MAAKKSGLGMGLDALFAENAIDTKSGSVTLRLSEIEPNRDQPRKEFDDAALAELADSIAMHGVLQPLIVRPMSNGRYQLVAGERRWRASRMAGLSEVPVMIRELTDLEVSELSLIENLQREDLSPLEEARGYRSLIETYDMTQEDVARVVGKSRSAVTNMMRLLNLPEEILAMVEKGELSAGHARTLLSFKDAEAMKKAAKLAAEQGLSVRELEKLAKKAENEALTPPAAVKTRDPYFDEVEIALRNHLGRKVTVSEKSGKGTLQIEFYSMDDLKEIAKLF